MKKRALLYIIVTTLLIILTFVGIYFLAKQSTLENYTGLEGPNNVLLTDDAGNLSQINFPNGMIVMWNGTQADIPQGWVMCDGKNNTPDLRGRFVVGTHPYASDSKDLGYFGTAGGSENASVTFTENTIPSHKHGGLYEMEDNNTCVCGGGSCIGILKTTDTRDSDKGTDLKENPDPFLIPIRPPYYALFYIMKVDVTGQKNVLAGFNNVVLSDNSDNLSSINFPDGIIMLWSGSSTNVPQGWLLCDSSNSTPDLRGRFIVGANPEGPDNNPNLSKYAVKSTGGAEKSENKLSVANIPQHTHSGTSPKYDDNGAGCASGGCSCGFAFDKKTATGNGLGTEPVKIATIPPYYAICYIIKSTNNQITNLPGFNNLVLCDDTGNMSAIQFPKGMICNYNGDESSIPDGWGLCDGKSGTPDLKARFTVGINTGTNKNTQFQTYDPADTLKRRGGEKDVTVTLALNQLPPHTHGGFANDNTTCECGGGRCYCGYIGARSNYYSGTTTATGGGQPVVFKILPPYYTLCFIMKL
jgi:microcystin-dependent protein